MAEGLTSAAPLASWLAYLETLHPQAIDLGLARVRQVAQRLDLLRHNSKTITVAGTNGKGSCVAVLRQLLQSLGFSVGAYTSPHLLDFNERIVINGAPVSDADITAAFAEIDSARADVSLSYFEFATLAALWLFRQRHVDWQILEVGLGGRLDAVNIVDADACVITSIGLDHTDWLGPTRETIAPEKAGVARLGKPAVVAEPDPPETLLPALDAIGAETVLIDRDWHVQGSTLTLPNGVELELPSVVGLLPANVAAAIVLLDAIDVSLTSEHINRALAGLTVSGRQSRIMWLGRDLWLDVAHNMESVRALRQALIGQTVTAGKTHALFAAMSDKPLRDMLDAVESCIDVWHLMPLEGNQRAATPEAVKQLLDSANAVVYDSLDAAWHGVSEATNPGDRVVVFGSFFTVGAIMSLLQSERSSVQAGG